MNLDELPSIMNCNEGKITLETIVEVRGANKRADLWRRVSQRCHASLISGEPFRIDQPSNPMDNLPTILRNEIGSPAQAPVTDSPSELNPAYLQMLSPLLKSIHRIR